MKNLLILAVLTFGVPAFADQITFNESIRPLFLKRCSSCHNAKSKLPNILEYETAFKLRFTIKNKVTIERTMPHSGRITETERDLIELWVLQGATE